MSAAERTIITVEAKVSTTIERAWQAWTDPKHIVHWNNASDDWHTPGAVNDLRPGGRFVYRMESTDGSVGFDFSGKYEKVEEFRLIEYRIDDGRKVSVKFTIEGNLTKITESFEAEEFHSAELQKNGWQAILNNFKKYVTDLENS